MFWKKKKPTIPALEITEGNFNSIVKNSSKPVLLDFWASWCMPCKVMGPIIDEIADEYEGRAIVGKVNTEHARKLAMKYKIRSIPTLLVIQNGKVVERYSGIVPKPNLQEILNEYVAEG